ncbi:MAG: GNAT family N-acetyltransferase [Ruminococcus sp.]|nr:GNAT family N-acetyltransferase [Ruminococcus sp.]
MSIEVINACDKHIPEIFTLLRELADFQHMGSDFKIDIDRLKEMILTEKSLNALVAVRNEEVVGTALYYTSGVSAFAGKKILSLDAIYIKEDFRKNSVGREIFAKLRTIAKENNCCRIEWKCQSWNVEAGNFFKIVGSKQDEGWTAFSINHI